VTQRRHDAAPRGKDEGQAQGNETTNADNQEWPDSGQLSEIRPDTGQAPERNLIVDDAVQASQALGRESDPAMDR